MIIGVTGTNGAGKGTVVDYLVEKKGFTHYSVREFLVEEIKKRAMPVDRTSMNAVGNDLRASNHPAYVVEQLFLRAQEAGGNAIIESIRAVGEVDFLKSHNAKLLAVDADPHTRYERAVQRGTSTDKVDFDTFIAEEQREMASPEAWNMSVGKVMQMADITVKNDGNLDDLHAQLDNVVKELAI
jgi:dephospho-CoA kinase